MKSDFTGMIDRRIYFVLIFGAMPGIGKVAIWGTVGRFPCHWSRGFLQQVIQKNR